MEFCVIPTGFYRYIVPTGIYRYVVPTGHRCGGYDISTDISSLRDENKQAYWQMLDEER